MNILNSTAKLMRLLALVLCFGIVLGACGSQGNEGTEATKATEDTSTEAVYTVTVTDAFGTPYTTGIIVAFLRDGAQVAMQPVNDKGEASKTLDKGEYTVELVFTGDESAYYYDKENVGTLTAEQPTATVQLANAMSGESRGLFVDGNEVSAYYVGAGCTHVTLTAGERNYFLFAPTMAGTYEFSVADATATIGYYGAPHFVQTMSAAELVDGKFTQSIRADMIGTGDTGTTVLVIGVDPGTEGETMLMIERIGEPAWSVADEPWIILEPTVQLSKYTVPEGANLVDFNLNSSYELVLNDSDGFYHLNTADGPLVLVKLGEKSAYLDSYKTILEHTGVNRYFYDDNGDFIKRENYTDCLTKYIENMDENKGMYPLTEDLKYIIQNSGVQNGWYDASGSNYLFVDQNRIQIPGINPESSWLFMCCYISG